MKKILTKHFLVLIAFAIVFTGNAFAQDTVNVDPGFNTLLDAVNNNPGKVFRLQRGASYVIDQSIEINDPTTIIGEKGPEDLPPASILRYADVGIIPNTADFAMQADLTFKYVAIIGWVTNNSTSYGMKVQLLKNSIAITYDHCNFYNNYMIFNTGGKDSLTLNFTNNLFWGEYNFTWWNGGYLGYWAGDYDNFNFINNTIFGGGRVFDNLGAGPHGKQTFIHNTYVNLNAEIYYLRYDKDFIVQNNIFYNVYNRGFVGTRPEWGYGGDYVNVSADTLEGCIDIHPLGPDGDSLDVDDYAREVKVNNNLRYTTDRVLNKQKGITASWQPVFRQEVLDFITKYGWKVQDNMFETVENQVRTSGIDPQFAMAIPDEATDNVWMWHYGYRDSTYRDQVDVYPPFPSYDPINPATGEKYTPSEVIWPIKDYIDLKPTNPEIQTASDDGYPLGDLNWYGPKVVADWEAGLPYNPVSVEDKEVEIPTEFALNQNYPNPFNPTTKISYSLPEAGNVTLKVFNAIGQEVATLVNQEQPAGNYSVNFDASKLSSGVYMYRIEANGFTASKKMMLLK